MKRLVLFGATTLILVIFIDGFNPFGLAQRIFFGMKPPYHWVHGDVSNYSDGAIDEHYMDTGGAVCAEVYRFGPSGTVTVYGYGFSKNYDTVSGAEKLAERECR